MPLILAGNVLERKKNDFYSNRVSTGHLSHLKLSVLRRDHPSHLKFFVFCVLFFLSAVGHLKSVHLIK